MPEANNWNDKIITEFRANGGRVGGNFESAPLTLVHHRGRNSGREYVNPMMYLPDDADNDAIYVFATKGGAPSNPDWYYNLTAAAQGTVERGTETYPVTVRELQGDERDRIYDEQARRYPGFADYAKRCRHQNDPGAGAEALLRTHTGRVAARGPQACSRRVLPSTIRALNNGATAPLIARAEAHGMTASSPADDAPDSAVCSR